MPTNYAKERRREKKEGRKERRGRIEKSVFGYKSVFDYKKLEEDTDSGCSYCRSPRNAGSKEEKKYLSATIGDEQL